MTFRETETIEWIPVVEGPPDDDTTVLVNIKDPESLIGGVGEGYFSAGDWFWMEGMRIATPVVAWAEMPIGLTRRRS